MNVYDFRNFYNMNTLNNASIETEDIFITTAAMISLCSAEKEYKYGSVIVKNQHIIASGFNRLFTTADEDAIIYSTIRKVNLENADIYVVGFDCKANDFIPGTFNYELGKHGIRYFITRTEGISGDLIKKLINKF